MLLILKYVFSVFDSKQTQNITFLFSYYSVLFAVYNLWIWSNAALIMQKPIFLWQLKRISGAVQNTFPD